MTSSQADRCPRCCPFTSSTVPIDSGILLASVRDHSFVIPNNSAVHRRPHRHCHRHRRHQSLDRILTLSLRLLPIGILTEPRNCDQLWLPLRKRSLHRQPRTLPLPRPLRCIEGRGQVSFLPQHYPWSRLTIHRLLHMSFKT